MSIFTQANFTSNSQVNLRIAKIKIHTSPQTNFKPFCFSGNHTLLPSSTLNLGNQKECYGFCLSAFFVLHWRKALCHIKMQNLSSQTYLIDIMAFSENTQSFKLKCQNEIDFVVLKSITILHLHPIPQNRNKKILSC